jgi:D-psicose/D-tagatose/L-ribulose 3-epimerase
MNKVGIYYAYWTKDWSADFVPYVRKARDLGFDILEVNAGTIASLNHRQRETLKAAAVDAGISLSCCIGLSPDADLASSDASIRKNGIRFLGSIADAMVDCGIDRLSGIIYSCWPAKLEGRGVPKDKALEWSIESMQEAIKKAEDLDLTYNVEVVNRFEQFIMNTAREGVDYVRSVGSSNLKVLLDTFHMNIEEDSIPEAIETAGPHLGHIHLGENNRRPPGTGTLPWDDIFSALRRVEYAGWLVMEPFLHSGGEVGRDISVFREIMPGADADAEAEKACAFVKHKLAAQ